MFVISVASGLIMYAEIKTDASAIFKRIENCYRARTRTIDKELFGKTEQLVRECLVLAR